MNILVLNGSPKGEDSITLQTVRYLEKRFGQSFEVLHVGRKIKALEKKYRKEFDSLRVEIRKIIGKK